MSDEFKVKLSGVENRVVFYVQPSSVSESRSANYDPWSLVHLPVDLYAYKNSSSRRWNISVQLVSRTVQEAIDNATRLHTIRSWLLPDFAASGAPPEILKFSAYGDPNINEVTCIMPSYNWNYPNEVDYVFGEGLTHKFPVIGILSIDLIEIYSASQIQDKDGPWKMRGVGSSEGSFASGAGAGNGFGGFGDIVSVGDLLEQANAESFGNIPFLGGNTPTVNFPVPGNPFGPNNNEIVKNVIGNGTNNPIVDVFSGQGQNLGDILNLPVINGFNP